LLKHYLPLKKEEIDEIWKNGFIVFDTNILLHLYRYDENLRAKLLRILQDPNINEKIWIPFRVYEEFLRNRPKVICEQWDIEQKIKSTIDKGLTDLKDNIEKKFSHRFHPYINSEQISTLLDSTNTKIQKEINREKSKRYNIEIHNDSLLEKILSVFDQKIGSEIDSDTIKKIYDEGKERFQNKIPPGYEDEKTKEPPECYSDLVIWKSIIEKAKDSNNIIFIIDDKKEDWWQIEKGKTIGPHPMLLKEFYKETNKKILFYNSSSFYSYVDSYIAEQKATLTPEENTQIKKTSLEDFLKKELEVDTFFQRKKLYPIKKRSQKLKRKYSKEEILDWFFHNYDDPANGVPYNSKEGGYQYYLGGPFDPNDEIQDQFPDIDMDTLNQVLREIYPMGNEWVKRNVY
jgi:predicted nucleic acid-binding protein